nr:exodeoxyribonuclease V subunit beta [Marinobacter caseinilyticus]
MTQDTHLNPLRLPLHGSRLIEASAGTGKTFTIALLYVRLILNHGDVARTSALMTPRDILVVTFTEAATKELRDRIRTRLTEAADVFRAAPVAFEAKAPGKDPLHDLRADYDPAQWPAKARLLQLAAESMDEAAVHTIHGWCNRMLKEHAFDSGGLFNQNLETDQSELQAQVARDYWRSFIAGLDEDAVEAYLTAVRSPEDLQGHVRGLLNLSQHLPVAASSPADLLGTLVGERRQVFDAVRARLPDLIEDFLVLCGEAQARKQFDGRKFRLANVQGWMSVLQEWSAAPSIDPPALTDAAWNRLSALGIEEAWKTEPTPASHGLIVAVSELNAQRLTPVPRQALLIHATQWIGKRLEKEKLRRAELGFDDLLTRLDSALQGEGGDRLAGTIRNQFPVALIDEFQDTDPTQYRIFDAIYRVADNLADTGFFMIGDPKQAIYAFRGADIFTYLRARKATEGRHVTLPKNFRSSAAMVQASNRVFGFAEAGQPHGAFLFRGGLQTSDNPLPFLPVEANGREETFTINGTVPDAITFWTHSNTDTKDTVTTAVAEACASEIARMLNLGLNGQAGFTKPGHAFQSLQSSDIAILVNKGAEARAIRTALAMRGVRSVYLSDRASVLQSVQAIDLMHWLEACAEPERDRLVRSALATATLGLGWPQLDHLRRNELAWEDEIERFRGFRLIWQGQGILAMVRRLLTAFEVPARLLQEDQGERALTDVLHLAELLQYESQQVDGEQALIRRFGEMIADAGRDSEAMQLRLESDADLVQVVTVHKSKGLEYPVVFLPFATSCRPVGKRDNTVTWHDDEGRLQVAFEPDDDVLAKADRERLGEDVRKLYVALTRARYATWVGAADMGGDEGRSALGYLAGADAASLEPGLTAMASDTPTLRVQGLPSATGELYRAPSGAALGDARRPSRTAREDWWIASYSAIQYTAGAAEPSAGLMAGTRTAPEAETPEAERLQEDRGPTLSADQPPVTNPDPEERRLHGFFRGAGPGTFLHHVLEWCADLGFGAVSERSDELRAMLEKRCLVRGWNPWANPLTHWVKDFIDTPLILPMQADQTQPTATLGTIGQAIPELEFWFSSRHVKTRALDAIVRRYTLTGVTLPVGTARPLADEMTLNGMLKGFIDLVFEHDGRYYVADYKSNYIGPMDDSYTSQAMAQVVSEKRYDLQYALYLLALHRLLKARIPDYDYDRHMGGAVYLFLRGSGSDSAGVHCDRPDRRMVEELDNLFRQRSPHQPASEPAKEVDQ